jgi:hypothetical protein
MGGAAGVSGSMAAISKTTGGMISNLQDNIDATYKALGDRFKPEIDATIGSLNSMVATVKSWVEIPTEKKIQAEIDKINVLGGALSDPNLKEAERLDLLKQLKDINPNIVEGIDAQAFSYEKLAANIQKVNQALTAKKFVEQLDSQFEDMLTKQNWLSAYQGESEAKVRTQLAKLFPDINTMPGNLQEKLNQAIARVASEEAGFYKSNPDKRGRVGFNKDKMQFASSAKSYMGILSEKDKLQNSEEMQRYMMLKGDGMKEAAAANITETTTGGDGGSGGGGIGGGKASGSSPTSISGGAKVTTLNISIGNLVNGGFTFQTTTLKESPAKIKDVVLDALMTAVNDVNLTATN